MILAGCATSPPPLSSPKIAEFSDAEVLHGDWLFGREVTMAPPEPVLALSPEMEAFLTEEITRSPFAYTRFKRLMRALVEHGYFANNYQVDGTFSAAQTFADRRGNCLGYTNMFIALARAARLDARYQFIETYPVWGVQGSYLVKNNHINVLVDNIEMPGSRDAEVIVDFNIVQPDPETSKAKLVSDAYALSLFHANIAVDYLGMGDSEAAFAHLKRAAHEAPENIGVWSNLGVLYSKLGHPVGAQYAYERVLDIDPNDNTGWVGMVVALQAQGKMVEAQEFNKRVEKYQLRNAYYHYAVAEQAFKRSEFDLVMTSVDEAIKRRRSEPKFYLLKAATAKELGDLKLMDRNIELAQRYQKKRNSFWGRTADSFERDNRLRFFE